MSAFAEALKAAREARGVSQMKLGNASGLHCTYLSRLERGQREPTRGCVAVLCEALGLDGEEADALLLSAGYVPERYAGRGAELARLLAAVEGVA